MIANQQLDHLLLKEDEDFIQAAYEALLGRWPDPEGARYYLERIRKGRSKIQILAQMRKSPEYKTRNAIGAGLDAAIQGEVLQSLPFIGGLFWLLGHKARQAGIQERLRALESTVSSLEQLRALDRNTLAPQVDNHLRAPLVDGDCDNLLKSVPIALRAIARGLADTRAQLDAVSRPVVRRSGGTHGHPSISIVINTFNRGTLLQKTLESLLWLKYSGTFEVIVVNGPSTDNSDEVIAAWLPNIRAGKCDVANLSVSRNIGICMARGDIVAFIDDDAIPEPEWLTQLAEAYSDPMVGAAGGLVYNHTGYDFQYKHALVDRFGHCHHEQSGPKPHLSFPKTERFPSLIGCNSSFRRSALIEIGGFDEEYEYFLDETDVQVRMVDAGYLVAQVTGAYVHHKFAPSNFRGENKIVRNRYPILKNHLYFMLTNAREFYSLDEVIQRQLNYTESHRNDVKAAIEKRIFSEFDLIAFERDAARAFEVGLRRGLEGVAEGSMINAEKLQRYSGAFLPFRPIQKADYKTIVLISRDFPPDHGGGIATFSKDLAEGLANEGNIVHVITRSPDINRVDFENGVWVHRMVMREVVRSPEAINQNVLQHIWNWSAIALEEAKRIATHRTIDIVEAPIWDCEGVAFLFDGQWPLVTSLHTTLHFWIESYPEFKKKKGWMASWGSPLLALERELMAKSSGVRANSRAIVREIERAYGFQFDPSKTVVIPHGIGPQSAKALASIANKHSEVLFVGRLEARKGIDTFLSAIPEVLKVAPDTLFRIVGDDSINIPGKPNYKEQFLAKYGNTRMVKRVKFEGRVSEETLQEAYACCDIFVAPSRFESFGLVFLEAMRAGKPVIGCAAGGMPEVVSHGTTGLLVEPGNPEALAEAIVQLIQDRALRVKMGKAGKELFEKHFTAARMAEESAGLYEIAAHKFKEFQLYMANCGNGRWAHTLSNIWRPKRNGTRTSLPGEMNREVAVRQDYLKAIKELDSGNLEPMLTLNRQFQPYEDA